MDSYRSLCRPTEKVWIMEAPSFAADNEEKYVKTHKLGEGTYAVVYKAHPLDDPSQVVAIKKIKIGLFKDGLDMSAIREIKFLQEICHPNVINLYDVYTRKRNFNLVLEYLESDLEMIIKDKECIFSAADIKSWMLMTLRGLEHCHRCWILHRDLKPNNLLLASDGQLKLADFGLARFFGEPLGNMSSQVVTRWYRCPELLYGAKDYSVGVDIWALGCIFAELMLRTPFLVADTDMGQLDTIFRALGTPSEDDWPEMVNLPGYVEMKKYVRTPFQNIFTAASEETLDLLAKMLKFDPLKRITAKQALSHRYFKSLPMPADPKNMPRVKKSTEQIIQKTKKRKQDISENIFES